MVDPPVGRSWRAPGYILQSRDIPDYSSIFFILHVIVDNQFPEIIHDHFTYSVFDYDGSKKKFKEPYRLKDGVLTKGNTVQLWKLLTKKGENWHVCCVIWHENKPHSFGFDANVIRDGMPDAELCMKSPNGYFEVALTRQKIKNPTLKKSSSRFVDLLAMGKLDDHMIKQLTRILTQKSNRFELCNYNAVFPGFEPIDDEIKEKYANHLPKLAQANKDWIKTLEEKNALLHDKSKKPKFPPPKDFSYNSTLVIPQLIEYWTQKPFQLEFSELIVSFNDFYYCRKDPGRKSSKKNCMGALDSIFQDIFSCRLFGTYIHPRLCGPKNKCFTETTDGMNTSVLVNTNIKTEINTERSLYLANSNENVSVKPTSKKITGKARSTVVGGGKKSKRTKKLQK